MKGTEIGLGWFWEELIELTWIEFCDENGLKMAKQSAKMELICWSASCQRKLIKV